MSNRKAGRVTSVPMDDFWCAQMQDPEFKRTYDALDPEFSIRRQLIDLRLKRGLSQRQLADKVGTPRPSISRMEAKGIKDLAFAQRLAEALDCTLEVRFVPKTNPTGVAARKPTATPAKSTATTGTRRSAKKDASNTKRKLKA